MTPGTWIRLVLLAIFAVANGGSRGIQPRRRGPVFVYEPPSNVDFSNGTGAVIPCTSSGNPIPVTRWALGDSSQPVTDLQGLRHVRPDGSLVFPPFSDFRPEVHAAVYRCLATSALGSVASRDVNVRGVLKEPYEVQVHDELVLSGNTAVLRCVVSPSTVREYLTVTSWLEEPTSTVIQPASTVGGRYLILPTGELYIRNVQVSHSYRTYRCQARHRLTGEVTTSTSAGRLVVTDSRSSLAPRIVDFRSRVIVKQGETLTLPCAGQASPMPEYHWFRSQGSRLSPLTPNERILQLDGTLVIYRALVQDSGSYVCLVNNSLGEEKAHTEVVVRSPLAVNLQPSLVRADLGRSASLNCTVSGSPVRQVEWRKDMAPLSGGERVQRPSKTSLLIDPVRREDKGMYQCFAFNDYESAQASTQLSLGDDSPSFESTFSERTMQPGPQTSLKCVATGSPLPQITWTLDEEKMPESHRIRFGDFVTSGGVVVSYVNISSLKVEDGGNYKCTADNGVGVVSHSARLKVLGPPVIRPMANVTAVAGEVMVIRCPAAGYPLEKIEWEKGGLPLPYNHRQKLSDNGTLEVHHVERSTDDGPYTCQATNAEGLTARGTTYVHVQVKPVIETFSFAKSLREGQRSSVMCTVGSGDLPIRIRWFRDGIPLVSTESVRISEVADYSSTLLFKSLRVEQRGNYSCQATNQAGSVTHSATMVIHVPPRWLAEPSDVSVIQGRSLLIDCQADGFPQPRIRWTKAEGDAPRDFKAIVSSPRLQVAENGSLSLGEAQVSDAGFYLCQATNGIGQGLSKVVRLAVHIAAHFKSKFSVEMVHKAHTSRLKCHAFGDKPLSLHWQKDKTPLNPGGDPRYELVESMVSTGVTSELIVRQTDRRDSALYTCLAKNSFGQDETNIQLIVQETPDSPLEVRITEVKSRLVSLEWMAPYTGNSPITQYAVQYKEESGKWHGRGNNVTVGGSETKAVVSGLRPAHLYNFRILAENRIGRGEPSRSVEAQTKEEAPGGPPLKVRALPLSSKAIKVTWKPPSKDVQYGKVKGYYVGYRLSEVTPGGSAVSSATSSSEPYIYKTLDAEAKEEVHLSPLHKASRYGLVVQAFNEVGAGPPSEEVFAQTFEHDPPTTPSLEVRHTTSISVQLAWSRQTGDENPVTGYWLYQRRDKEEWQEVKVPGNQNSYVWEDLLCGNKYHFFLLGYNAVGKGQPTEIMTAKTEGRAPVAPDHRSAVTPNVSTSLVHLQSWGDGGCPISSFTLRYKAKRSRSWTPVSERLGPHNRTYALTNLSSGLEYDLQVTATNSAGDTQAEYAFTTLLATTATNSPKSVVQRDDLPFLLDTGVLVPVIVVSLLVLLAVLLAVCALVRRKNSGDAAQQNDNYGGLRKSPMPTAADSLPMSDLGKGNKQYFQGAPYGAAPNQLNHDQKATEAPSYHQLHDEPLYATVKRTPRPPRTDGTIYHCPVGGVAAGVTVAAASGDAPNSNGDAKTPINEAKKKGFLMRTLNGKARRS